MNPGRDGLPSGGPVRYLGASPHSRVMSASSTRQFANEPLSATEAERLFLEYRTWMIGRPVRSHRLAGNSLILYVDCEPADSAGLTVWIEPTWNLRDSARVLTGSREAQHLPDAAASDAGFRRAAEAVATVQGRIVTDAALDRVSGDLTVRLDGGLMVQTFVSHPGDGELWHIRESASGARLSCHGHEFVRVQVETPAA